MDFNEVFRKLDLDIQLHFLWSNSFKMAATGKSPKRKKMAKIQPILQILSYNMV